MSSILTALGIVCLIGWAYRDGLRTGSAGGWSAARRRFKGLDKNDGDQ